MTPEAFVKDANQLAQELQALHPECIRMIDSLLELVEEQRESDRGSPGYESEANT